jgi:imidazole glycerol-phosphate synthase subunit HisH
MRVTIVDYGAGNLHSLGKALAVAADDVRVEADPVRALDTDVLVLPGVGAFASATERLAAGRGRMRAALDDGLPALGICLGMQLLFDASDEGTGVGLGLISGRVTRLRASRVPQIGWNRIEDATDPLFAESGLEIAYYANGFACRADDPASVIGWSTHGDDRFPAAVRSGRVLGVQFHPEKSSVSGVRFLARCLEEVVR